MTLDEKRDHVKAFKELHGKRFEDYYNKLTSGQVDELASSHDVINELFRGRGVLNNIFRDWNGERPCSLPKFGRTELPAFASESKILQVCLRRSPVATLKAIDWEENFQEFTVVGTDDYDVLGDAFVRYAVCCCVREMTDEIRTLLKESWASFFRHIANLDVAKDDDMASMVVGFFNNNME